MDFHALYATDPVLEEQGKVFDKEFGEGITMTLARTNNTTYTRIVTQLYEAHKFTLDQKDTEAQRKAGDHRSDEIMVETLAKSVLLGWTGPVMYKGEPLPYSVANAMTLLRMKDFRKKVEQLAGKMENYRLVQEQDDAKNLTLTSDGTSNGAVS